MVDTDDLSDLEIISRTIWGENRGGRETGMANVASVILNRAKSGITWWGKDIRSVCLCPWQFSCWNFNDPNRTKVLSVTQSDPEYSAALAVGMEAIAGTLPDSVNGATSYYARSMKIPPKWSIGHKPVAEDAGQLYFII